MRGNSAEQLKPTRDVRSAVKGSNQSLTQTSDPKSITLTPTQPRPKTSSGLSLAPDSTPNNLGQITPGANQSGNSGGNSGSAAPKPLDPATFGQYEKYKDGESALFAELQVGTGDALTANKKAAVYYKGWLTDGRLFDMTRADKDGKLQPFVFEMGARQVIAGWEQGLGGMKVGGTRLLIVPPAAGYGAAGQDPIPPNSVLVFQVQLLAVQ